MLQQKRVLAWATVWAILASALVGNAGDWPQWRYDAQRSATSPDNLPAQLRLHWVRQLPRLKPAWPDQPKMQFDAHYEPIVAGQQLIVGSSFDHTVTAYDTRTGGLLWRFFAEGPVRFAPLAWQNKVYFVADDGYLYCLNAADGAVVWRFRGGPSDRKILGNERLISMWPARGAPVIEEGKLYFTAGIWPFMGIFLHALDAETGRVLWTNDGDGSTYMKQPHNTDSFAGVAPQGALVVIGDRLLIPGGRSVPACYDRSTGKLVYYQLAENGKKGGGSAVAAVDQLFFNGGAAFDLTTERYLGSVGPQFTFAEGKLYDHLSGDLRTLDLKTSKVTVQESVDRKGVKVKSAKWSIKELSEVETPELTALIRAGSRLFAGSKDRLLAWSLPLPEEGTPKPAWEAQVAGTPASLIAADDKLFAVTQEGELYCFGTATGAPKSPPRHSLPARSLAGNESAKARAAEILKEAAVSEGYCLVAGLGSGELVSELARQSKLRMIVVEPDSELAGSYREQLASAGFGGERVTVLVTDMQTALLPPYLFSLAAIQELSTEDDARTDLVAKVFASLRPFGGTCCLPVGAGESAALSKSCAPLNLAGAVWKSAGELTLLSRAGALPDSADWTHEHADAANTRVSKDKLVKAPLGLLWFGGPPNDAILPRHGHGPQPQVVEGRAFIEGVDLMRAVDIYTGRLLWESSLPGVGALYNNTSHQPGANASGTNYIATTEGIYVAVGKSCVKLDPATGKRIAEFQLPTPQGARSPPLWGYLNVVGDYLIGGADPYFDPSLFKSKENDNYSASRDLVVMDRDSGQVQWTAEAQSGFRHNAICVSGGRLYAIDRQSGAELSRLKRRGETPTIKPRLVAYNLKSGHELWSTDQNVFGTWLSYSAERDVLVEAGRTARDTLTDEPKGMRAYRAAGGSVLWENLSFTGPAMIHHDTILMAGNACDLLTGALRMREHPLSGEPVQWTWSRNYGCNTPAASEHLLTFRSGAAGYLDFCNDGGTGNFGGFRSSCTNNLIVAGGVLCAPDYTRTCTCSYQNQTSLALVHMPEAEMWTSFASPAAKEPVRRLGLNLGAPGDRKADDGTLWLELPSIAGSSPAVGVKMEPAKPEYFRRHSSQFSGEGISWVAASGAKGLSSLRITLADDEAPVRAYQVRLHFAEPDSAAPGERIFSVSLQGEQVVSKLDIVKEAGGPHRGLVKQFTGVRAGEELLIELQPEQGAKIPVTVLCGIEILAEGW